jgi:hypothetical protein
VFNRGLEQSLQLTGKGRQRQSHFHTSLNKSQTPMPLKAAPLVNEYFVTKLLEFSGQKK